MPPDAHIRLESPSRRALFDWRDFDGDDCFGDLSIAVASGERTHRFEFGPCATRVLRKVSAFLASPEQPSVSGGFQHPDVRTFTLHRSGGSLWLVVRFEGSGLHAEFDFSCPAVEDSREFVTSHYGA